MPHTETALENLFYLVISEMKWIPISILEGKCRLRILLWR